MSSRRWESSMASSSLFSLKTFSWMSSSSVSLSSYSDTGTRRIWDNAQNIPLRYLWGIFEIENVNCFSGVFDYFFFIIFLGGKDYIYKRRYLKDSTDLTNLISLCRLFQAWCLLITGARLPSVPTSTLQQPVSCRLAQTVWGQMAWTTRTLRVINK